MQLRIGDRGIGPGLPCFIVAEVGLAHDGSLMAAHAYIDVCARAGVDAVKFQCHLEDTNNQWRVSQFNNPTWGDKTRADYWVRTGFGRSQWRDLADHCGLLGLEFLCSPFSVQAVEMLDLLVPAWKVPSGKVTDTAMLDAIAATHKPVLLSTGMATSQETAAAMRRLLARGAAVGLMQCSSLYPTAPNQIGLRQVKDWGGLSDHSGTIYPGIAAAALGCQVLEVHVCFSKDEGGFDTAASLDMGQLRQLVEGVRFVEAAMEPVDKDVLARDLGEMRRQFMGAA